MICNSRHRPAGGAYFEQQCGRPRSVCASEALSNLSSCSGSRHRALSKWPSSRGCQIRHVNPPRRTALILFVPLQSACYPTCLMPMPARPQFSLRWLLGAVTACCILVGGLATDWGDRVGFWLTLLVSVGASTAVLVCLVRLASGAAVPSRRQLATCGVAGAFVLFLMWELEKGAWWLGAPRLPWYWVGNISSPWSIESLSLWATNVSVWRVLRREQDDALLVEARHASRLSLAILGGAAVVSALLLATTFAIRGERRPEPEAGALLIVVCAGIVAAFPWIRILRRRAVVRRRFGFAEYASLTALGLSIGIMVMAMPTAVVIWSNHEPPRRGIFYLSKLDLLMLFYFFPLIAASVFTLIGVVLELWRDQWHPRLTTMAGTCVSLNWIAVILFNAINSVR
jgi:hypothetical protein